MSRILKYPICFLGLLLLEKPLTVISLIVAIVVGLATLIATIIGLQKWRAKELAKAAKKGELEAEREAKESIQTEGRPRAPESMQATPTAIIHQEVSDRATAKKRTQVFISYRHQTPDSSLANDFAKALQQAGHEIFIDTELQWGANWAKRIREALERAEYLLLLLSKEAAASELVVEEVAIAKELAAQKNGIPIILPLRIRLPFSEPLPYHLAAYLRAIQQEFWNGTEDTSRLVSKLLETVSGRAGWLSPIPEASPLPGSIEQTGPQPYSDPRRLIIPGGAIEVESGFYIKRDADEIVFREVKQPRAMIRVHGPRQTGKTSLMMRVYADTRGVEGRLRAAFVDFQGLTQDERSSLNTIWHAIARYTAEQLQSGRVAWNSDESYDQNFSRFVEKQIFGDNQNPLLLCLDETDRLFGSPIKSDFFASLRAYYNRGALSNTWKKVRWLLAVSSEPHFFIEELNQSPFNVGLRVDLSRFSPEEVLRCAHAIDMKLAAPELEQIMAYVGGHPYLVHLTLYHLARNTVPRAELFNAKTAGGGIYRDHLHRFLIRLQAENDLAAAMKEIINGKAWDDAKIEDRLKAAGLVRRDDNNQIVPFCRLYFDFFRSELK